MRIATATCEIYVIDLITFGCGSYEEHQRLLQELEVSPTDFDKVLTELAANGVTLREIKDATSLAYNQIRAVIAVLIQGYGEHN